jgi:hypothetical protein
MVTALAIEAKEGTIGSTNYIWSKAFLIGGILMLLSSHLLNLSTAEQNPDVGTYFRKHTKVGIYMPIIFNARLIALTSLLFLYHITPTIPSYLIIIIQVGYVLLIVFGRPHKKGLDIFRAFCIEVGLLYLLVMRFTETKILAENVESNSMLYSAIAIAEYVVYSLGATVSTVSMVYHTVKRFKSSKVGGSSAEPRLDESPSP